MILRTWYFFAILLAALLMGTSLAHSLEMPMKMQVDGPLWRTFQHSLYRYFAIIGGPIEIGAILSAAGLAFFARKREQPYPLILIGTACLAAAFLVWLGLVSPVNTQLATWTSAEAIPTDWMRWRAQWEYAHLARFILHLTGLSMLLVAGLNVSTRTPTANHPPNRLTQLEHPS
ncbi:MAG TPA: DUF1772 domain-containing protein [Rhodothermales bacterium]|nr:DUF1772 domain-containing protein [Rhodothermales bacterium]